MDSGWRSIKADGAAFDDLSLDHYQPLLVHNHCASLNGLSSPNPCNLPTPRTDNEDCFPLMTKKCGIFSEARNDSNESVDNSSEFICRNQTSELHDDVLARAKEDDSGNSSMSGAGSLNGENIEGRTRSSSSDSKSEPDVELAKILERHGESVLERNEGCECGPEDYCERDNFDIDKIVVAHHLSNNEVSSQINADDCEAEGNDFIKKMKDSSESGTPTNVPFNHIMRNSSPYHDNCPLSNTPNLTQVNETSSVESIHYCQKYRDLPYSQLSPSPVNVSGNSTDESAPFTRYTLPLASMHNSTQPGHKKCLALPPETSLLPSQKLRPCQATPHSNSSFHPSDNGNQTTLCHTKQNQHCPTSTLTYKPYNQRASSSVPGAVPNANNDYTGNDNFPSRHADQAPVSQETRPAKDASFGHEGYWNTHSHTKCNCNCKTESLPNTYAHCLPQASNTSEIHQPYMPQNASFSIHSNELQSKLQELDINGQARLPPPDQVVMVPIRRDHPPPVGAQGFTVENTNLDSLPQQSYSSLPIQQTVNSHNSIDKEYQSFPSGHCNMKHRACYQTSHPFSHTPRPDIFHPYHNNNNNNTPNTPNPHVRPNANRPDFSPSLCSHNSQQTTQSHVAPAVVAQHAASTDTSSVTSNAHPFPANTLCQANNSATADEEPGTDQSNEINKVNADIGIPQERHRHSTRQRENSCLSTYSSPPPNSNQMPGSDESIPMATMMVDGLSVGNSDSNFRENQGRCLIPKRYCPDYTPFCLMATLLNPLLGPLALLANWHAKKHYRHLRSNAANNLYFVAIVLSSVAIFSTLTGLLTFAARRVLSEEDKPKITTPPNDAQSCRGLLSEYDEELLVFYKLDYNVYCKVLENTLVMEALIHFSAFKRDIYAQHRELEKAHKDEGRGKTNVENNQGETKTKFAPPLKGGVAASDPNFDYNWLPEDQKPMENIEPNSTFIPLNTSSVDTTAPSATNTYGYSNSMTKNENNTVDRSSGKINVPTDKSTFSDNNPITNQTQEVVSSTEDGVV